MESYQCKIFENFSEFLEFDTQLAMRLIYRLGLEHSTESQLSVEQPWTNHELIVYPTEYDFGVYQLQDGLYRAFNLADNDYGSLRGPLDFVDMNLFGKRLAEDLGADGDNFLNIGEYVFESPYGFR